jgi:hypothetical protein
MDPILLVVQVFSPGYPYGLQQRGVNRFLVNPWDGCANLL